jgi:dihydrolipoamide dehydrogenase
MPTYDLAVIGGGPGGYVAAIRAAQLGGRVALIERKTLGGTCLNVGCIPTKALLHATGLASQAAEATRMGLQFDKLSLDLRAMIHNKDEIVGRLVRGVAGLMKKNKIEVIEATGCPMGEGRVQVSTPDGSADTIHAQNIIIATGSQPVRPKLFPFDDVHVVTSDAMLSVTKQPQRLLIVGGGYIGCEFACIFRPLGTEVTLVEMMDQLLPGQDDDLAKELTRSLKKMKIKVLTGTKVDSMAVAGDEVKAKLSTGEELAADTALISIGRMPYTEGLRLAEIGVKTDDRGCIVIDDHCRTTAPGLYAIGDVTGKVQLAHVASKQGLVAAEHALGKPTKMNYRVIPACIFTRPEIATVGLTERQAAEQGLNVKVGRFPFAALGKALAIGDTTGFVKLIGDVSTGELLGAAAVGPGATDTIAELAVAIQLEATVDDIAATIHAHPTLPEAWAEAAEQWEGRGIHL